MAAGCSLLWVQLQNQGVGCKMVHTCWPLCLLCPSTGASAAPTTSPSAAAWHPHGLRTCPSARIWRETRFPTGTESIAVDPPCQAEGPAAFPLASKEGHGKNLTWGLFSAVQPTWKDPGKADPASRPCMGLCRQNRLPQWALSGASTAQLCPELITSCLVKQIWPSVPNVNKETAQG